MRVGPLTSFEVYDPTNDAHKVAFGPFLAGTTTALLFYFFSKLINKIKIKNSAAKRTAR